MLLFPFLVVLGRRHLAVVVVVELDPAPLLALGRLEVAQGEGLVVSSSFHFAFSLVILSEAISFSFWAD